MSRRRDALAVGLASSLLGLLLLAAPTLTAGVDLSGTVRAAPFVAVGVAALVVAGHYVRAELEAGDAADAAAGSERYPRPGNRPSYARPGASLVDSVAAISWTDRRQSEPTARLALRSDVRDAAVHVLSETEGWSRSETEARLREGDWTTDARAAAFFADDAVPSLSVRQHLRSLLGRDPPFARRARHAVAELVRRDGTADASTVLAARTDESRPATTRRYWSSVDGEASRAVETGRARQATVAALAAGGFGIVTLRPALLLLSLFGVTVAGYARVAAPPSDAVRVTRTVGDDAPEPGSAVEVTVTVENAGETTLPDVRLVDGVPAGLAVTEGTPRFTTALRPGRRATFSYTVEAAPGVHEFDPALVVTRDLAGLRRRETLVDAGGSEVACRPDPPAPDPRLGPQRTVLPGQTRSTVEGSGVEFRSVREYRPGDPLSRVDWNRKAKTGEFTTVDFRESRLARVLLVVDARRAAYLTPDDGGVPAVRRSVAAARSLADGLVASGVPVGITALSPRPCWLPPGAGADHRRRLLDAFAGDDAFSWDPPVERVGVDAAVESVVRRVDADTQLLFLSPLCDDDARAVARRLDAHGYPIRVVSPDPTASSSDCAHGYASIRRRLRLRELRNAGLSVLDWDPTVDFERVVRRES